MKGFLVRVAVAFAVIAVYVELLGVLALTLSK
jgi:hypothetical protein